MADRFNLGSFLEGTAFAVLDEIFAEFRSDDGFARPSRYEVFFFPPVSRSQTNIFAQIMGQNVADQTARKTSLRCESFEFPGRTLDTAEDTNIYGPVRNIVSGYSYGDVTAVFQCSSDMKEKRFFETWQRLAYNPQTWSMQYYNDYVGSIKLFQLDETDRQRYGVEMIECFPKTIAPMDLGYGPREEIRKTLVTWTFRDWINIGVETGDGKGLGERLIDNFQDQVVRSINNAIPAVVRRLE
mgnify:CR=1 FL=1